MRRIGIDTGGTFTDCVLTDDEADAPTLVKVPSQPSNPELAIANGIARLLDFAGLELDKIDTIVHGTTIATNAVITGQLACTGMITSRGSRDVLEIGSQQRPKLYDLQQSPVPIPVPRNLRIDVPGRIAYDGSEIEPVDAAAVEAAVQLLLDRGAETIAVAGLFSFINPSHELLIREIVERIAPGCYVACSSSICPEVREYPRFATTATNAALGPILNPYISKLESTLSDQGFDAPLYVMQSSGGVGTAARSVGENAHHLILSGPAAGVIGGVSVASASGFPDVVTLDVGGTSADIGLATASQPRTRIDMNLPNGIPLKMRNLEIETIGAGGGSIAWIDAGGALCVGPMSAGADPGPVCYGAGGTEPTLTDAQVVLGRLNPQSLLAGDLEIDREAAWRALGLLGEKIGLSAENAALGVVSVVEANMAGAIRRAAARHGDDLRDFALVAAGGAGPLNAVGLADDLNMKAVCVPPNPGLLSAIGLLMANLRHDLSAPLLIFGDALSPVNLSETFDELENKANVALAEDNVAADNRRFEYALDLRYVGQDYTVAVPVERAEPAATIVERFHALHEQNYGHSAPQEKAEVTSARLIAWGEFEQTQMQFGIPDAAGEAITHRDVWFEEQAGFFATPVFNRHDLGLEQTIEGPAIIEQLDATTVVPPDHRAVVERTGTIVIRARERTHD